MSRTDSPLFPDLTLGPNFDIENRLIDKGIYHIAGIDEAGRGPLAGPVVAAAVILDPDNIPQGLHDSKQLSGKKREALLELILKTSHVAWSSMPAQTIDAINIRQATLRAMTESAMKLAVSPNHCLIDGRDVPPKLATIGTSLVKGDARSLSIAAASIIAKVIRDRMMKRADLLYPKYGFAAHKGYGTQFHRDQIADLGPCPLHRHSFEPIKTIVSQ